MVISTHKLSSNIIGEASDNGNLGACVTCDDQKIRTPKRISATIAKPPDSNNKLINTAAWTWETSVHNDNKPAIMPNLATNPDNGGIPTKTKVQPIKLKPKNAKARGITTPGVSSSCTSSSKLLSTAARCTDSGEYRRSVNSNNSIKAATAKAELSK